MQQPGQFADLTVFDPARIADRATYLTPFRYAEGVRYVVVNGRLVAQGEVVVIGNNFGVKITNVIRPSAPEGMDSNQMNYDS